MNSYEVTIIIPTYNEERFIKTCLDSIYQQSYPANEMEIIIVDGRSNDRTNQIIKQEIEAGRTNIRLLENPKRIQASAMNLGILASHGKYIIRMDAHSTYDSEYVRKCIDLAVDTGADNVGGTTIATSQTRIGKAISLALSCPFGVGNAIFRLGGRDGKVESVPFGTFPRETFIKFGLFNESLVRCEDKEFNHRIWRGGGRIFMSKDIRIFYNNRETIRDLSKQSHDNGLWNVITFLQSPGSLSIRHFVPLFFVSSLIGIGGVTLAGFLTSTGLRSFIWILALELGLYFILSVLFAIKLARKTSYSNLFLLPLVFFTMHMNYGLGSIEGIFRTPAFLSRMKRKESTRVLDSN